MLKSGRLDRGQATKQEEEMRQFYRRHYFLIRRLHSFLGIIPVGAFFLVHMLLNSRAAQSPEQYQWVTNTLDEVPFVWAIEIVFIILPILFHGLLGLLIVWQSDPNCYKPAFSWYINWAYLLQRITGVVLLVLILIHLWQTYMAKMIGKLHGEHEFRIYELMHSILSKPFWLAVYIIFVLFAAYHFAHGIFNFAYKWGITTNRIAQRWTIAFGLLIGFVGLWLGYWAVWGLKWSPWALEMAGALTKLMLAGM
jgi:succinate dehydrogenase / fumarate reductase cytochrome b subunit